MGTRVLDKVWMVVHPDRGVIYDAIGNSPKEVWEKVVESGFVRKFLTEQGWRAKKVEITIDIEGGDNGS